MCLSGSCPHGPPLGQCLAAAPPLGPLSVLGHVEADKENGESVWVARSTPAAPGPGDGTARVQSSTKDPEITQTLPSGLWRGRQRAGHTPSPVWWNLELEAAVPRLGERKGAE